MIKTNKHLDFLFSFLTIILIIGFPRIYGTDVPLALILLPFYIQPITRRISNNLKFFLYFFLLLVLWFDLGLLSYSNGNGVLIDLFFHIILFVKIILITIFGLILYFSIKKYPHALLLWIVSQCSIIMISVFNKDFYLFLTGFISPRSADMYVNIFGYHTLGFGLCSLDGAVLIVTAMFFYCLFIESNLFNTMMIMSVPLISMTLARSAIVPYVLFSILTDNYRPKIYLFILILLMCILSLLFTDQHKAFYSALELFRNYMGSSTIHVKSVTQLISMYIFPQSLDTYFIGDGKFFAGMTASSSYYMQTDVGYLRLLYFSGVISLALFILINIYFIWPVMFYKVKSGYFDLRFFALGLMSIFIITNLKGIEINNVFCPALYFLFKDLKKLNTKNYPTDMLPCSAIAFNV